MLNGVKHLVELLLYGDSVRQEFLLRRNDEIILIHFLFIFIR